MKPFEQPREAYLIAGVSISIHEELALWVQGSMDIAKCDDHLPEPASIALPAPPVKKFKPSLRIERKDDIKIPQLECCQYDGC